MCLGQNDHVDFREILRNDYSNDFIKEYFEKHTGIPISYTFVLFTIKNIIIRPDTKIVYQFTKFLFWKENKNL